MPSKRYLIYISAQCWLLGAIPHLSQFGQDYVYLTVAIVEMLCICLLPSINVIVHHTRHTTSCTVKIWEIFGANDIH